MTLLQLQYAITIGDCGSMRRAAGQLYVSQPTVSCAIQELENEIGITIFRRTPKGVIITADGEEFLAEARQILGQYQSLENRYSGKVGRKQKFAVSSQHYVFVDQAFAAMVQHFGTKKYDFTLRETCTSEIIRDVVNLRSELGILFRSSYNKKALNRILKENDLEFSSLTVCRPCVCLSSNHPLASYPSLTQDDLADYPALYYEQGTSDSAYLMEEILPSHEFQRVIYTSDRSVQCNLMTVLNAFTLCSGLINTEKFASDFVLIPLNAKAVGAMDIGYIRRTNLSQSEFSQVLLEELRRSLISAQSLLHSQPQDATPDVSTSAAESKGRSGGN